MSDPTVVIDLIDAFRRSKCMFTAVRMGVFEQTPGTREELAKRVGANVDALERLLQGCVALGLLEVREGVYENTDTANDCLKRTSPQTLAGYVAYSDQALYPLWGNLESAVREGSHRWEQTFGLSGPIFSHFFRTREAQDEFLLGMHGYGVLSSPRVVAAFNLGRYRRLVDLGGGTGHLALAAAERYPQLRSAVFDLPTVVETAKRFTDGKVELIGGDFFLDLLPEADLYALGRIVHDWSREKIDRLLARIYAALPEGGGLLLAERLLLPEKDGPTTALMQSLNMLVCTEGKERTAEEYEDLLRAAGFARVEARITGAPLDAILAVK